MSGFPFPTDPILTGISIAYMNPELIADAVLPRKTVALVDFRYYVFSKEDSYSIPSTHVGRRSQPNEITFEATEVRGATSDYGLDDPIPSVDIRNAPQGYDPVGYAVETMTNIILLEREVRVAGLVFNDATYPAANKVQLSGTDQWSDFTSSDPIGDLVAGMNAMLLRPTALVVGSETWQKLALHPKIVSAIHGKEGQSGFARPEQLAQLLRLRNVWIGDAFVNTASKGQAPVFARVWGKHAALIRQDILATPQSGATPTFGFTAQYLKRVAGQEPDSKIGLRGGQRVRVGESVQEIISAPDLGYFIEDAVA